MMFGLVLGMGSVTGTRGERALRDATASEPTYDHVGSTLVSGAPGPRARRREHQVADDFDAAVERMRSWAAQRSVGGRVHPPAPPEEGATALVVLGLPPGPWLAAPVRIVQVIDEPDRAGFAYGTLPGHPERGEESFVVERRPDGTVWSVVTVEAVPGPLVARVVGPLVQLVSTIALGRYTRAIAGR
jgi:uncharacterized protein (UPF0548 family)